MKYIHIIIAAFIVALGIVSLSAENILKSTEFENRSGWRFYIDKAAAGNGATGGFSEGKAVLTPLSGDNLSPFPIQLINTINIDSGKAYLLKFKANTDSKGKILVSYHLVRPPYTNYSKEISVNIKQGENEYECTLAIKAGADGSYEEPRGLYLNLGALSSPTSISDVSLDELR